MTAGTTSGRPANCQPLEHQSLAAGLTAFVAAAVIFYDVAVTRVPPAYAVAGPTFIPKVIGCGFLAIGTGFLVRASRQWGGCLYSEKFDLKRVGILVASLLVFAFILESAGWIIASTALFGVASATFGSHRYLVNTLIGAIAAVAVQLLFVHTLGLRLPAGILTDFVP